MCGSYSAHTNTTPDLYLIGTHAQDIQPPILLTGVTVIAVPSVVHWDVYKQGRRPLEAIKCQ